MSFEKQNLKNIVVIDIETGGLNHRVNGICSITMKKYNEKIMKTWYVSINPFLEYEEEAFKVNGLSFEELNVIGLNEERVVTEIIDFLQENFLSKPIPLGQNLKFDLNFIEEMFRRYGVNLYSYIDYHYLDTMLLSGAMMLIDLLPKQRVSLGNLYEYFFKEQIENQHSSQADVIATEKVFVKLCEELKNRKV